MFYLILTIFSTVAKFFALSKARQHKDQGALLFNRLVLALIFALLAQSFFEGLTYIFVHYPQSTGALLTLKGYYLCLFVVIGIVPCIAVCAANIKINPYVVFATTLGLVAALLSITFSNAIIAGVDIASTQTLTKLSGKYYWVFQICALLSVLFTVSTLASALISLNEPKKKRHINYFVKLRCFNLLVAFIPVSVFAFFIIFAMSIGIKINAAGVLPLCFLIWVTALVHNMRKAEEQPDYSPLVPFSQKNRLWIKDLVKYMHHSNTDDDVSEVNDDLVRYYLSKNLRQKDIAKMLNVSNPTISRAKKRLKSNGQL